MEHEKAFERTSQPDAGALSRRAAGRTARLLPRRPQARRARARKHRGSPPERLPPICRAAPSPRPRRLTAAAEPNPTRIRSRRRSSSLCSPRRSTAAPSLRSGARSRRSTAGRPSPTAATARRSSPASSTARDTASPGCTYTERTPSTPRRRGITISACSARSRARRSGISP